MQQHELEDYREFQVGDFKNKDNTPQKRGERVVLHPESTVKVKELSNKPVQNA